jgi:anti-sigma regulatory factor (Ser/Thr protein kinase)
MLTIRLPKKVTHSTLTQIFDKSEQVFLKSEGHSVVVINGSRVEEIDFISQLTIYKIISYLVKNNKKVAINFRLNDLILHELKESGFYDLLSRFTKDSIKDAAKESVLMRLKDFFKLTSNYEKDILSQITDLSTLDSHFGEKFYIAPFTLIRTESHKKDKQSKIKSQINTFYADDNKKIRLIHTCIEEIYMNFWRHATEDSETVMLVHGTKKYVEIMVADNGQGIRTTLSNANYGKKLNLVSKAVERGVTSRPNTNHMGWGLWLVSELARKNKGVFRLFSEGDFYSIIRDSVHMGNCGFWKGTVIYLSIPLNNGIVGLEGLDLPEMKRTPLIRWENSQ